MRIISKFIRTVSTLYEYGNVTNIIESSHIVLCNLTFSYGNLEINKIIDGILFIHIKINVFLCDMKYFTADL